MAIAFAKGITVSAPGLTTIVGGGGDIEVETYDIDEGTQEFEENNDLARDDDYVRLEASQKKYGTLTISGKGIFTGTLGAAGPITFTSSNAGVTPANPVTGYGIIQNFKNTVNARQKPTFSVTYQLTANPSSSSSSSSSSSQGE